MPGKGIGRVRANFKRLSEEIADTRTNRAVFAILSQGAAMAATMTPMDTGTLLNSHFVEITETEAQVKGRSGYTANYAKAVQDAPGKLRGKPRPTAKTKRGKRRSRGNYWDPSGEPDFLRKGFEEIRPKIPAILRKAYRVK